MKTSLLLSGIAFLFVLQANATIWRVNNNTGVQADYTNVPAAVSAAAAGDTIYVEGSATAYSNFTIDKQLTVIGTGYFLTDTANHKTQWNTNSSKIGGTYSITFDPGSQGSKISGLETNGHIRLNDSLITIERCYTKFVYLAFSAGSYADHDTIRQCVLYGVISHQPSSYARGVMIYNNLFTATSNFASNLTHTTAYFINNVFETSSFVFNCENSVFQNNIFLNTKFGAYGTSNYFSNNLFSHSSSNTGVPTGNNNQFSVNTDSIFVAENTNFNTVPAGFSHDGQYQLAAGSPALDAGDINGTTVDCGIFGGPAPYILSGMPNIPSIYSLTVPTQVNSGTATMNISLSAAAH